MSGTISNTKKSYTYMEVKNLDIDHDIEYTIFIYVHRHPPISGVFPWADCIPYIRCYMQHTCWTCRPRSRSTHGSRLLILRPSGVSVLLCDCLDALRRCPTVRAPGNMEFSSPPAPEKSPVNPVGAAIIAIAADKAGKGDRACPDRIACTDRLAETCWFQYQART